MKAFIALRRFVARALLVLVVLVVVAVAFGLGFRAYRQHVVAEATAIRGADGIVEGRYVKIGGIDQWIQIRGWNRANPVILCLHGGPGGTWLPLTPIFAGWERHFTVVMWDQRGAGRTLESTGDGVASTMTIERMAQDGIEVAEFLRSHLHKDRILLLGHSFGSILGIRMASRRPELFSAYIGTGQAVDMPRGIAMAYDGLLNKARADHDERSLATLAAAGKPPFETLEQVGRFFDVESRYDPDADALPAVMRAGLTAPGISLFDLYERQKGFSSVPPWSIYREILATDLRPLNDFQVPVYFVQGAEDDLTPASLVREYFDGIRAPHKELVLLPGAGHFAVWIARDRFLQELLTRVVPRLQ
ncbi:MAG TPA: alpha/beta hydrolase [Usitatibacter sp.]|nr:alpha/beta hydrolase [Usitatibacter sp.]